MTNNFCNQINSKLDVSVNSVLSNKNELVHRQLYTFALESLKEDKGFSDDDYRFLEKRDVSKEFNEPTSVVITKKDYPYSRQTIDLTPYWSNYEFKEEVKTVQANGYIEIIAKDYANDRATIYNKYTGETFFVKLNEIGNIPYSEDWYKYEGDLNAKSAVTTKTF